MKATKQCPKCDSRRVGHLATVHDQLVHEHTPKSRWAFTTRKVGIAESKGWFHTYAKGQGGLEAYLCADCGYFETYVKDPASVPFDKLQGFSWCNPESVDAGPYR